MNRSDNSNSYLNLCTSNVQSLNKAKMELIELELAPDSDIICLNERNHHNNRQLDFRLDIEGYQPIFR